MGCGVDIYELWCKVDLIFMILGREAIRRLSLLEHDAMGILGECGARVGGGILVRTIDEAGQGGDGRSVVKAQVLAGGRGVGVFSSGLRGGVKVVNGRRERMEVVGKMLGHVLVTPQTGPEGLKCLKVRIAEPYTIVKEYYVAVFCDRNLRVPVLVGSRQGGSGVESNAAGSFISIPISFGGTL